MSVHYSPGTHPVAVTPQGFAVLADDTSPALAARIHALVADGRGLGGVLEALTGAYGTSLSAVPPFAVALAEGGSVRLAVRGSFALDVDGRAPERVSGEGVTTWTERVIAEASRVSLDGGADAAPPELPVADGVVLAGALVWVPSGAGEAGVVKAEAAPAAESPASSPEPAPAAESPASSPEPAPAAEPQAPALDPAAGPEPAPAPEADPDPEPEPTPEVASTPTAQSEREPGPRGRSAHVPGAQGAASVALPSPATPLTTTSAGLIDSAAVLSLADADTLLPAESTLIPRDEEAEHLSGGIADDPAALEATVVRPAETPVVLGDHDGETISLAEARALRGGADPVPPLAPPRPPAPGRIRVSSGQVVTLDRTVVIGRRPRSTRVSGTDLPHLVAVDSPQQDISRSHVELRVEGDSIVATDLNTTNGTTLLRPGVDPMRLHPGEATVVVPGDVIDLGDGITVAIEDIA
ncbi:FHA domain-containing protein [Microbacterium sp. CFH 31415]|uniref:FHA domain-containing protein n=1 Tax=Microbacterium sp. CFH 31415 TaxID=2921732 RepID=UPI001F1441DD|nr:FHA domain-containing protein [Microbacterium sp. CFH 31415]MCH6230720.1 FHA domain-containing protein [Microbacterium sp. CFH 31415]